MGYFWQPITDDESLNEIILIVDIRCAPLMNGIQRRE